MSKRKNTVTLKTAGISLSLAFLLTQAPVTGYAADCRKIGPVIGTGKASWYNRGRLTANGELFDKSGLSAAHKGLAFNSYVLVTNLDNGARLVLRINDRGPYAEGRIIDVSERAAEVLGFRDDGWTHVKVTHCKP